MKFYDAVAYLVGFVLIYNVLDLLSARLQIRGAREWPTRKRLIAIFAMALITLTFVIGSCVLAFMEFSQTYSQEMAIIGTSFFMIAGVVLLRRLGRVAKCV